jgi:hypothetical protein
MGARVAAPLSTLVSMSSATDGCGACIALWSAAGEPMAIKIKGKVPPKIALMHPIKFAPGNDRRNTKNQ